LRDRGQRREGIKKGRRERRREGKTGGRGVARQ